MSSASGGRLRRVLLTGAASLVGAEVLRRLLEHGGVETVSLLLPADEARRRADLERLAAWLGPLPSTVETLPGDLRLPRFGLPLAAFEELAARVDTGLNCAQRPVPDHDLALARQAHVRPVESWILLLGRNPELRLHHLSTGFVGGTRRGLLTEFDLSCGQGFHNAWDQSAYEAEVRLRESAVSGRVTVYRPSHVVGRADGTAFELGGSYPLLATLAAASLLPGDGRARIDFVPADHVAAALVALAGDPGESAEGGSPVPVAGTTFHLACGWHRSPTVREAAALAARGRGRSRGARLLPRAVAAPLRLAGAAAPGTLSSRARAFTTARDALNPGPVFDTYLADLALEPHGLAVCPAPESYLEAVVREAEARGWQAPPAGDLDTPAPAAAAVPAAAVVKPTDPAFHRKLFHQVGDVRVAYRDIGDGEPVVFLHGFAGAGSWDGVIERLGGRCRALVVETLGLGDSEAPVSADFGLPAQAAMVRGLLSALEIPSAHLVGNDTGGAIAQIFAVRWPHCVRSLVLSDCDAAGNWPPTQVRRLAALMRLPGGTRALTALMRLPAVARSRQGFGRMVHDKSLLTRERLARYLEPVAASPERRRRLKRFFHSLDPADLDDITHLLEHLEVPTMVVWGADDEYWSPSWGKKLYDEIPGARRLELIPFAGISCHEERPDLFARLLGEFFDQTAAERHRAAPATESEAMA